MTLDGRARQAVRALDEATAEAGTVAALDRVLRRQRRALPLQLAVAAVLVLVLLAGALLLGPAGERREVPAGPAPTTGPKSRPVRPPGTILGTKSYPIPPGPPFPRVAASAFPPLFDSGKVRDLRRRSAHPLAFPTWLPARFNWRMPHSQVLPRLTDYYLQAAGSTGPEIEVFHSQLDDGRSTDPLDHPVKGLTMPNGLKVFPYQDMVTAGTDAYIVSDRHEYVIVYFHDPCGGSSCLTRQERWRFVRGLAMVDHGR
ncbi:MAG TPA: hypothetical protein VF486_24120 [Actinomycetes bacterium]